MPKLIKAYKSDFTIIDNKLFKDRRLSCKDIGLLCLMISLPDDWSFSIKGLSVICLDGISSIRTGIENLEKCGYLTRKQGRDADGSFDGYDYYLYMDPDDNPDYCEETPLLENPTTVNPMTVNPISENCIQDNIKESRKKEDDYSNNKNDVETKVCIGFDRQRIIDSNRIDIARLNEATRNDELTSKIIDYLSDSCNCFGLEQIATINKLPDSDFRKLFSITCDIVIEDTDMDCIYNHKAYLSSQIKKCIAAYNAKTISNSV